MRQRLSQIPHLMPVLGYLALSLLTMATALPSFMVAIPGGPVAETDGWQNVWNLWWVQRALATPTNPFFTPLLFYPEGVDLTLQTLNISNGLLFAPITALFGPIAAYNSAILAALILSGVGGYALALRVSGDRLAAFIGGAVFAFSPFHLTKIWDGQLELVALQWIAFYGLFLLRAAEDLRRRDALLAGLFLALIGYTSWYYLLFCGIYSILFAIIWLAGAPRVRRLNIISQLAISSSSGAIMMAPLLYAAARAAGASSSNRPRFNAADPLDPILIHSVNLYDLFLPNGLHPLWSQSVEEIVRAWHPYIGAWNIAPGFVALLLAITAIILVPSKAWRWTALGISAVILALGPLVQLGTLRTAIPLPYQLLLAAPGMDIARRPSHFIVILTLMLAPLAALGLQAVRARLAPRRGLAFAGIAAALLAFEYLPPIWPLHPLNISTYYQYVAANPGAVLEIPPHTESSEPLKAQIIHGQPILGGFVSRRPPYPFVEQTPGIRQLWMMRSQASPFFAVDAETSRHILNSYNIRHIIVFQQEIRPEHRPELQAAIAQALGDIEPVYSDEQISAYVVPPTSSVRLVYAAFGAGWQPEEYEGARRWRWMSSHGEISLVNPTQLDIPVQVSLYVQAYERERSVTAVIDSQTLGQFLVQPEGTRITFRLLLPPGEQRLSLRAPATTDPALPRREISIVALEARITALP